MIFIPTGPINTLERHKRLVEIRDLSEQGKTDSEISKILALPLVTVRRNLKYLDDLCVAELTSREVAEKRSEIYLELIDATSEAKKLFEKYRDNEKSTSADIKRFFSAWLEAIDARAKLYGLGSMKVDNIVNVNTQYNTYDAPEDKLPHDVESKISELIKKSHEQKVQTTYEASRSSKR